MKIIILTCETILKGDRTKMGNYFFWAKCVRIYNSESP